MSDPVLIRDAAIIDAAARALQRLETDQIFWDSNTELRQFAEAVVAAVTPLILANERKEIAEQARRARTDDLDRHTLMGPPGDFNEL